LPKLSAFLIGRRAANIYYVRHGRFSFDPPGSKESHPPSLSPPENGV
jgi:hypothetical protein